MTTEAEPQYFEDEDCTTPATPAPGVEAYTKDDDGEARHGTFNDDSAFVPDEVVEA